MDGLRGCDQGRPSLSINSISQVKIERKALCCWLDREIAVGNTFFKKVLIQILRMDKPHSKMMETLL